MRAVLFVMATVSALILAGCAQAEPPGNVAPSSATAEAPPPPGAPVRGGASGGKPGAPNQASATGIKALDQTKFGQPITEASTTSLPAIAKDPAQFANKTVRTEGLVSAVCQSMGCWMQITDTSGKAHIKMAGHAFFVPKESSGHRAVVQGRVLTGNQPNACGADGCGNKEATQVEIEATGIELID